MRLLPLIDNTQVLLQFQGSLLDSSGNGLNASVLSGSENYEAIDSCIQGFRFDDGTGARNSLSDLILPLSSLLQFTGEYTFEYILIPRRTFVQTFFACETPGGQSLYSFYTDTGIRLAYGDTSINTFLGDPSSNISYTPYAVAQAPVLFAERRRSTGGNGLIVECFIQGIKQSSTLTTTTRTAVGTERLRIGGFTGGFNLTGTMASFRVLSVARSDAGLLADANFATSPCSAREPLTPAAPPAGGALSALGAAGTGHHFRYNPKAFGDVYHNPGRTDGGAGDS